MESGKERLGVVVLRILHAPPYQGPGSPVYGDIHYATSDDGLSWEQPSLVCTTGAGRGTTTWPITPSWTSYVAEACVAHRTSPKGGFTT